MSISKLQCCALLVFVKTNAEKWKVVTCIIKFKVSVFSFLNSARHLKGIRHVTLPVVIENTLENEIYRTGFLTKTNTNLYLFIYA